MNQELLRIVDAIHRDKEIDKEIVFSGIEAALLAAGKKFYGEEANVEVKVDRATGEIIATHEGETVDADSLGRISAQTAKQIIIQKVREAERDKVYEDYIAEKGTIVTGVAQRQEGGVMTVALGKAEAILPRSEQIPGEAIQPGERLRALLLDVRKNGQRVKLVLSRAHPEFIRQLFEQEIPEVAERIIEIRSIAREAGFRTKVAVSSIDSKVDCVGACVGVRGSRIKTVLDELEGERIDIIRYNDQPEVMIPYALSPAQVDDVQIYPKTGRAIVIVRDDQLSLAIGKRGQNVRLASKLCGIDIEIMTMDELEASVEQARAAFAGGPGLDDDMVDALIEEGILSYDDLSVTEPDVLAEMTGMEMGPVDALMIWAERKSEERPNETGTRSAMLAGQPARASAAQKAAEELLGDVEKPVEEKGPTARELFGEDAPAKPKPERKLTADELFKNLPGEDATAG